MDLQQSRTLRHGGAPERFIWAMQLDEPDDVYETLMEMGAHRSVAYAYAYGYHSPTAAKWVLIRIGGLNRYAAQLVVELSAERQNVELDLPWSYQETSGDETTTVTITRSA